MNINFIVDKEWENKSLKELLKAPVNAIQGISEGDAELLYKAFYVKTVEDLANLKYVKWAQALCTLANGEQAIASEKKAAAKAAKAAKAEQ